MRARLIFPPEALAVIRRQGFRQRSPERLRWTTEHSASRYGGGVLLRGKSSEILDGYQFRILRDTYGARIETDDQQKVARALGVPWQDGLKEPGIEPWPDG